MRNAIVFLGFIFFISCGETPILEKRIELNSSAWKYSDSFDFPMDIVQKDLKYKLELEIQHSDEFNFQNLYTRIKTDFPNGKSAIDTVSIQLSDKYGRWFGKCNSGNCTHRVVLKDSFNFVESGLHNLQLEQYSRSDYLEGVQELSFALYQY